MSDPIKHECGIVFLRLKKPLSYYQEKYNTPFWGIDKMFLLMEKQHNRGQDGAGFASIKLDMSPGEKYLNRYRSASKKPIQEVYDAIRKPLYKEIKRFRKSKNSTKAFPEADQLKKACDYYGEVMLGHVRYGTFGANHIENVHPFIRQNNWLHRNLVVAGNFNMTNVSQLFNDLVKLGQHPKKEADTVTVMENIGHFLDEEVHTIYEKEKRKQGEEVSKEFKIDVSEQITNDLDVANILKRSSRKWDGGYVMAGILGHGDAFVLRDPNGIRPAFYVDNEDFVVVASERPVIQSVFDLPLEDVNELPLGHALIVKKSGATKLEEIKKSKKTTQCSFERIYFSRGSDADIYKERKKLGELMMPLALENVNHDIANTVFSYIPNTAELSFLGLVQALQINRKKKILQSINDNKSDEELKKLIFQDIRVEKLAIKDAKLRTFISSDSSRETLTKHAYDITYGVIKPTDNIIVMDDSIVRGNTLKNSILKILDRLNPKQIIIFSSAPQIRYPDCYGIDMAKIEDFIAFQAAESLHRKRGSLEKKKKEIYELCKVSLEEKKPKNHVKLMYEDFSDEQISDEISELLSKDNIKAPVKIVFQTIENLHKACPNHTGDWYFSGNYPTKGGLRTVNRAFINYYEGNKQRAY